MALRLIIGLVVTVVALAIAGRRAFWLFRLIMSGQKTDPERLENIPLKVKTQITEVFGQKKLLQWSIPGIAHFVTFWSFLVLGLTILEAYGALFSDTFSIPIIGHWAVIGFVEDLFAALLFLSLLTFLIIRVKQAPAKIERRSRFFGSHTGAAYLVLFMILMVDVTLVVYRAAQVATVNAGGATDFPYPSKAAFLSHGIGSLFHSAFSHDVNHGIETVFILAQLAVIMGFLVLVMYSKHLHIFLAPVNVLFKRQPKALGSVVPMLDKGQPLNFEEADPEEVPFGIGKITDFKWTGLLDMATCTECGRCQSQCPAWNTGKPLSPKLLITDLRDHMFARAPWTLGKGLETSESVEEKAGIDAEATEADGEHAAPGHRPSHNPNNVPENERPLVGTAEEGGVIDPDVLWSCTNCGACVEQCPVDIEHVDHIIDMRRYQVLVESSFPSEAGVMLRNLENNGNPWGVSPRTRTDWTEGLPFDVRVIKDGDKIPDDVEYLFWVGCAGAIEDRSKKVTRAFAELMHTAGVEFAILGSGESCTGDPARRLGNEYLWSEMATANVETLNAAGVKKIVATCPHCFNSLAKEYRQLGGEYEVLHHTQLLGQLVETKRLVPITPVEGLVTYHDPCFLGRHNTIYTPPREVLAAITGLRSQEMHRCKERGFCCGAGGARMWMEEKIGKQVNVERVDEALGLDPDMISTACPFCMVMLSDAVTAKKQSGDAKESVEVLDVSQLLARSLVGATVGGVSAAAVETVAEAPEAPAAAPAAAPTPAAPAEPVAAPTAVEAPAAEDPATATEPAATEEPATATEPATVDATAPPQPVDATAPPAAAGTAAPAIVASDTHEGERPVGDTPAETATADYPQLAEASTSTDSTPSPTPSPVSDSAGTGTAPVPEATPEAVAAAPAGDAAAGAPPATIAATAPPAAADPAPAAPEAAPTDEAPVPIDATAPPAAADPAPAAPEASQPASDGISGAAAAALHARPATPEAPVAPAADETSPQP